MFLYDAATMPLLRDCYKIPFHVSTLRTKRHPIIYLFFISLHNHAYDDRLILSVPVMRSMTLKRDCVFAAISCELTCSLCIRLCLQVALSFPFPEHYSFQIYFVKPPKWRVSLRQGVLLVSGIGHLCYCIGPIYTAEHSHHLK